MLTQVEWGVNGLHYCLRQETDFPQHTNGTESSTSALDLWKLVDPTTSSEALFTQARSKPMKYKKKKKKILSVRQTRSSGCTFKCFKKRLQGNLTWRAEATSNADLGSKEESILPVTKTLFNLGNDLDSLNSLLGKVKKL